LDLAKKKDIKATRIKRRKEQKDVEDVDVEDVEEGRRKVESFLCISHEISFAFPSALNPKVIAIKSYPFNQYQINN